MIMNCVLDLPINTKYMVHLPVLYCLVQPQGFSKVMLPCKNPLGCNVNLVELAYPAGPTDIDLEVYSQKCCLKHHAKPDETGKHML